MYEEGGNNTYLLYTYLLKIQTRFLKMMAAVWKCISNSRSTETAGGSGPGAAKQNKSGMTKLIIHSCYCTCLVVITTMDIYSNYEDMKL